MISRSFIVSGKQHAQAPPCFFSYEFFYPNKAEKRRKANPALEDVQTKLFSPHIFLSANKRNRAKDSGLESLNRTTARRRVALWRSGEGTENARGALRETDCERFSVIL